MRTSLPCRIVVVLLAVLLVAANNGWAGNWPGWRGPTGAGTSDETGLPLTWGGKNDENVLWKVKFDGRGHSSPVVWGDRVFLTGSPKQTDQEVKDKVIPDHAVLCLAAADGKELWRTTIPHGPWPTSNYAIPTPATDGKLVYAWFGSGVMAAFDFAGKIVWRHEHAGPFHVYPDISSSPLLYGASVLILCDQGKDSFLLALDKKTGEVTIISTASTSPTSSNAGGCPPARKSTPSA